ncbi:MAG TPA: STAS domain-containing protein [Thermoanaerobaculia bacterium]|nr:STAS domain-containing protein [Thermoanaerobaculia bacterium]
MRRLTSLPFCTALRQALAEGYGMAALRQDLMAGVVVGTVAVPLSMALAVAAGVPPLLAPLLGYLPLASLAALLLVVAFRMSEYRHVARVSRRAPRSDVVVLWSCLGLTVAFDMVVAVSVGVVLAALLFMRRMAEVAEVRLLAETHPLPGGPLPPGLIVYEVAGPLFFGAAQRAMSALERAGREARAVVLDLSAVPVVDGTGMVNLESALERLDGRGIFVALGGVQRQPFRVMLRAGLRNRPGRLVVRHSLEAALVDARRAVEGAADAAAPAGTPAPGSLPT